MTPAKFQNLLTTGLAHHQAGRLDEADRCYAEARAAQPNNFDALHLSGTVAYQQARYIEAIPLLNRALRIEPKSAICEMRLGLALAGAGRGIEAINHLRDATRRAPQMLDAWLGLAITLRVLGKLPDAIAAYRGALAAKPSCTEAIEQMGVLTGILHGPAAGIPHFQQALAINPRFAAAWCSLGLAQIAAEDFSAALESFSQALAIDSKLTQAKVGRGLALQQTYQLDQAIEEYGAALQQDPSHHAARSARLLTLQYLSDRSRESMFQEHLAFGGAVEKEATPFVFEIVSDFDRKLKVAFFSADLRTHSVAYFIEPLLTHLDRARFEIYLYHDHFVVDSTSERLRGKATTWRNFVGQLDDVVEKSIRVDAPDILIDLSGHTGINRLPLFARRLAPVQINYLGYPNTTGLSAMDFRFVDSTTDPEDDGDQFHTEKLIRFSDCAWSYQPPSDAPPAVRQGNEALTFASFNTLAKLSRATLDTWAKLLVGLPKARLLLKGAGVGQPNVRDVVLRQLQGAGIDVSRVELLGRTPDRESHLRLYQEVDVALDPFPYNGTTTTCEALWMGVPVVTLRGDRHASRVGASLLHAVGHAEWIASNPKEYVSIAIEVARKVRANTADRSVLRAELQSSILMDHATQARRFGNALVECFRTIQSAQIAAAAGDIQIFHKGSGD